MSLRRFAPGVLAALLLAASAAPLPAATITINNLDGAGEGFNDPTPVAPVGGNPGTTVGQQRLNVFTQAASMWGAILPSTVTIVVNSNFNALTCNATSAVLGSAGPTTVHANFPGAEVSGHWYHQALANRLRGSDNSAANNDIQATFNSNIGQIGCLQSSFWYYGFDHNEGTGIDLLAVVLHELGHGLGFSTTTNVSTGAYLGTTPLPHIWDKYLQDRVSTLHWNQMSNAQRQASAISVSNLVWDGPATTVKAPVALRSARLTVNSPGGIAGDYVAAPASFGSELVIPGITQDVVLANDGSGTTSDGCEAFINAGAVNGRIAFVDRGNCPFVQKVTNAQNAGAIGVIVADNGSGLIGMSGLAPAITIPSLMISQADGNTIRAQLGVGVNATLTEHPTQPMGTSPEGRVLMYAPNPVEVGSSVSHFDVSATGNLLMEPFITSDLTDDVDLTRYLFEDIGWFQPRTTGVPPSGGGPGIALRGAPNPFQLATTLRVDLAAAGMVELTVMDVSGRAVRRLMRSWLPAGTHMVSWDGADESGRAVPAGVYLTRLKTASSSLTSRIVRVH